MMATQEPTDPSVLLNSHVNNSNSMNHNSGSSASSRSTGNTTTATTSTTTTTTTSNGSSNGTMGHTLLKETTTVVIGGGETGNGHLSSSEFPTASSPSSTNANTSATPHGSTPGTPHTTTGTATPSNGHPPYTITAMSATRTPPRSSLANDPNLTPIASIKRPRANLLQKSHSGSVVGAGAGAGSSANGSGSANRSTPHPMLMSPASTMTTTNASSSHGNTHAVVVDDSTPLSPMHKIKPVLHRDTVAVMKSNATLATMNTASNNSSSSASTHADDTASSHPEGLLIKDKVDELFSPVVQFLHDHEHQLHQQESSMDHHVPRVTKSTSDDLSIELDFHTGENHHYSTDHNDDGGDDDEEEEDEDHNVAQARLRHDEAVVVDHEDDDVSMSRPEQHDYNNEGEFNPWQFIASLPIYESVVVHRPPVSLPPLVEHDRTTTTCGSSLPFSSLRKTLVLDLDETLVHCSVTEPADHIVDFTFPVEFHGETYSVHVKCRPYLQQFLNTMCEHFEVIVFTASQKVYADALLNILDPSTYIYILCCFNVSTHHKFQKSTLNTSSSLSHQLESFHFHLIATPQLEDAYIIDCSASHA